MRRGSPCGDGKFGIAKIWLEPIIKLCSGYVMGASTIGVRREAHPPTHIDTKCECGSEESVVQCV